jgi:two-component system, chemotaxis family, protein-glutamate methylesterase/glutaminase
VGQPAGPSLKHLPGSLTEIEGDEPGVAADIVCPVCHGKLTESESNGFQVFHCHVGHSFSLASVAAEQAEEVERALWSAARSLEECAALSGRLAGSASGDLRRRFVEKAHAQLRDADVIRNILLAGGTLDRIDATDVEPGEPMALSSDRDEKPS